MKYSILLSSILALMLIGVMSVSAAVTVTPAPNGSPIAGKYAADGATPAYRAIGDIVITENLSTDIAVQTNATLILTAPSNWTFQLTGVTVSAKNNRDITAISVAMTATTITVTFTTDGITKLDEITISGVQVQAINGQIITTQHILRTSTTPGTAVIAGITNDVTNFGSLSSDGVLPVELVSLTGTAHGLVGELSWKTATEVNNFGFEIERREDGAWTKVGFVPGAGTTNAPHEYAYTDQLTSAGKYAYRLKQIDRDGAFAYSSILELAVGFAAAEFRLDANYPNPFNPSTTLTFTVAQTGQTTLKIFNILGEEVAALFAGEARAGVINKVIFDASSLPSGSYISVLESGGVRSMHKMIFAK